MRPTRVRVHLGEGTSFDVHVVYDHLANLGAAVSEVASEGCLVVLLEEGTSAATIKALTDSLEQAHFRLSPIYLPAGEAARDLDVVVELYDELGKLMTDEDVSLVCVGGRAICDVATFVCATLDGLKAPILVPMTFPEMLQAHIGGRCFIDIPAGRGLVHSHCQPRMVYDDMSALEDADVTSYEDGCVRLVRSAILASSDMLRWLSANLNGLTCRDVEVLHGATLRSLDLEASMLVCDDPDLMSMGDMPAMILSRMLSESPAATSGRILAEGLRFVAWLSDELFAEGASARLSMTKLLDQLAMETLPLSEELGALPDAMASVCRSEHVSPIVLEGLGKPCRVEMSVKALEDYLHAWLIGRKCERK